MYSKSIDFKPDEYNTSLVAIENLILSVITKDKYKHELLEKEKLQIRIKDIFGKTLTFEKPFLFRIMYSLYLDPRYYRPPFINLIVENLYESKIPKGALKKGRTPERKPVDILIIQMLEDVVETVKRYNLYSRRKHAVMLFNAVSRRTNLGNISRTNGASGAGETSNAENNTVNNTVTRSKARSKTRSKARSKTRSKARSNKRTTKRWADNE